MVGRRLAVERQPDRALGHTMIHTGLDGTTLCSGTSIPKNILIIELSNVSVP